MGVLHCCNNIQLLLLLTILGQLKCPPYLNSLRLPGVDVCDTIILLLMKCHCLCVVKDAE